MTVIVGESGCVMTTLMKLPFKFYLPTDGQILYGGTDISHFAAKSIRQNCGIVIQDNFLFSDTVRRNFILGEKEDEQRLAEAAHIARLDDFVKTHPVCLYTKVGSEALE